jgi:hypothetical protein
MATTIPGQWVTSFSHSGLLLDLRCGLLLHDDVDDGHVIHEFCSSVNGAIEAVHGQAFAAIPVLQNDSSTATSCGHDRGRGDGGDLAS